ncbi:MAG: hypothetical protein A3H51_02170 [Candidatus Spechtbacteria bacterium RIFCSPLOWO2_02_FULL_38_8]|uniref:Uncharacterized protein n=1 Tax=Candidatus Spechtbacteria bacterium RIFCSPLOWO2_02_FULL_38_8 TaxID=1802164 RepID=A0A1G2HG77_9BACT|nr:MAG: hypothetical protein A3H51_02170 [Candidatus Spechtbacteria bacterium RIFCSPLOWO2_02_FULL_38_8]
MKFLKFIVKVVAYCLVMPVIFVFSAIFFVPLIAFLAAVVTVDANADGKDFLKKFIYWFTLPLTNLFRVAKMVSEIVDNA